jgi:alkylation response protein AidB-like acyl-CoA dehydrogenase
MDFHVIDNLAAFRDQARAWVERHVRPEWIQEARRTGSNHNEQLHRMLAAEGWLGVGWPRELGGTDADPAVAATVFDELQRIGMRSSLWNTTRMVISTIGDVAPDEQRRTIIPRALRGEWIFVLGYTEPDSGSDVAAARTRAVRDGDEWVVNGTKMFTSGAEHATHVFLLTRTNPDAAKHAGLTTFLVPMDEVDWRPVHTLGGQRTSATFYSDVRVPDWLRIGDVDGGWAVMRVALVYERGGGSGTVEPAKLSERVARWAQRVTRIEGGAYFDDPTVRERIVRIAIDEEVSKLLLMRTAWISSTGALPAAEGPMAKLFSSEATQRHFQELVDLLGADGVLHRDAVDAPLDGEVEAGFRSSVVGTIYGGSSEIMREIIADRRLGLPRNRPS